MKKEDLMIGDWVDIRCEGDPEDEHMYSQVEQLWECEIDADFETDYENVYPIPLTSELLEKNGFYEIEIDKFQETRTRIYVIPEHEEGFAICGNDELGYYLGVNMHGYPVFVGSYFTSEGRWVQGTSYPKFNAKYVHQLQHILKLFEIEKEIVL